MPTDDERREVARRLRHEARTCIHSVLLSPDDALRLADLVEPSCDRDALLALADEMEEFGKLPIKNPGIRVLQNDDFSRELGYARRIRKALGVSDD